MGDDDQDQAQPVASSTGGVPSGAVVPASVGLGGNINLT
jgi:hypothetical protein